MRNIHKVGGYIYITNDEEIKEGYWCFEVHNSYSKSNSPKFIDENGNTWWLRKANANDIAGCSTTKKIILTTNQDLIKDGVQAIDNEFLEWFIKNQNCEHVEVQKGFADGTGWGYNFLDYKIIIPEEETLEESAERLVNRPYGNVVSKSSFIEGAKWKQELICKSEVIQKIRNSKSDAEARRIIRTL